MKTTRHTINVPAEMEQLLNVPGIYRYVLLVSYQDDFVDIGSPGAKGMVAARLPTW